MAGKRSAGNRTREQLARMALLGLCSMAVMWTGVEWNCMSLYATAVMEEMGVTRTVFMFSLTIDAAVSAVCSLFFFGKLEQRFGIRRFLVAGGAACTLAFFIWAVSPNIVMFYVGSLVYGIGAAVTGYTCIAAAVNRWYKQRMGSYVGIVNTCGNVASMLFSLIIAALILAVGWRTSFLLSFVLSIVAWLLCFFLYKGDPEDLGVEPMYAREAREAEVARLARADAEGLDLNDCGVPFDRAKRHPGYIALAVAYLVMGIVTYSVMASLALFANDLGFSNMQGVVVSVSLAASAIMLSPLGAICDRLGSRWGLTLCCALIAAAALLLRFDSLPLAGLLVAAACTGVSYNCCIVPIGVSVKEAFGEVDFSRKLGVPAGCSIVGIALGPVVINFFYELCGNYHLVLLVYVAVAVLAALVFHRATRRAY